MKIRNIADVAAFGMCHGCGACAYACGNGAVTLLNYVEEGTRPVVADDKCRRCGDCLRVCSGVRLSHDHGSWPTGVIDDLSAGWGPVLEVWEGHATDDEIWSRGSSGGAATALALYCLEHESMHGVLHVEMDPERPYLNRAVLSRSRAEVTARTGSRYSPAAVCGELGRAEEAPAPIVLVGKPCDIAASRMARSCHPRLDSKIGLAISIFCAGTSSTRGTHALLDELGVDKDDIADLRYRGYGWPGMTGVSLKEGNGVRVEMSYQDAWNRILSKFKTSRCEVCPDGTGEFADIACGDPWYRPVGPDEKGSSLILVRTELGRRILDRSIDAGCIAAEQREPDILPQSQLYLMRRRRSVWPKLVVSRLLLTPHPILKGFGLFRLWLELPLRRKFVSFRNALRRGISLRKRMSGRRSARLPAEGEVV